MLLFFFPSRLLLVEFVNWCVIQWFSCATCGSCSRERYACESGQVCGLRSLLPLLLLPLLLLLQWFQLPRHKCICFYSLFWSVSSVVVVRFFLSSVFIRFIALLSTYKCHFIEYVLIAVVRHRLLNKAKWNCVVFQVHFFLHNLIKLISLIFGNWWEKYHYPDFSLSLSFSRSLDLNWLHSDCITIASLFNMKF